MIDRPAGRLSICGKNLCVAIGHYKYDKCQALHDGSTHWALPIYTTNLDCISKSQQYQTVLTDNFFRVRLSWKCVVSWYFEASQPQRITSRLKTMFNLHSACKSSNHKLSIKHKISPDTNLHKTKHTQTSNTKFSKNSSLRYDPCYFFFFFLKHIRLGYSGIVEHSVDLSIPQIMNDDDNDHSKE